MSTPNSSYVYVQSYTDPDGRSHAIEMQREGVSDWGFARGPGGGWVLLRGWTRDRITSGETCPVRRAPLHVHVEEQTAPGRNAVLVSLYLLPSGAICGAVIYHPLNYGGTCSRIGTVTDRMLQRESGGGWGRGVGPGYSTRDTGNWWSAASENADRFVEAMQGHLPSHAQAAEAP